MLSASQAADRLGISRSTLLRWFREGRISHVNRDFRGWRTFSEDDLVRIQRELGEPVQHEEPPEERRSRARMRAYLRGVPAFRQLSETVIDELAARGHEVAIAVNNQRAKKPVGIDGLRAYGDRVRVLGVVPERQGIWSEAGFFALRPAAARSPSLRWNGEKAARKGG